MTVRVKVHMYSCPELSLIEEIKAILLKNQKYNRDLDMIILLSISSKYVAKKKKENVTI